jgi:ABC-type phosphate transport system substrate-binding protein
MDGSIVKASLVLLTASLSALAGCVSTTSTTTTASLAQSSVTASPSAAPATTPAAAPAPAGTAASSYGTARKVKSKDGRFEGEIVGNIAPGSRFARLQIGMTLEEVTALIGAPDNMVRHETGKRWIPFYYGNDSQRVQVLYRREGCLTFTGGNVFGGGGNELVRITATQRQDCMS